MDCFKIHKKKIVSVEGIKSEFVLHVIIEIAYFHIRI